MQTIRNCIAKTNTFITVIHLGNLSLSTVQVFHRGIPRNEREEVDTSSRINIEFIRNAIVKFETKAWCDEISFSERSL